MDAKLKTALAGLPLGPIHFFDSIPSTNTYAADLARSGTPDLTLVAADEQTAGRGRQGRGWHTPPGSALAFTLVLDPPSSDIPFARFAGLGALAVQEALATHHGLPAAIKWPNDVLIAGRKVCGVLAEAAWDGNRLSHVLLGIGINVKAAALPPPETLRFPATSVEAETGAPVNRWQFLREILTSLMDWRAQIDTKNFVAAWESRLAYLGQQVIVGEEAGKLAGLDENGRLVVERASGRRVYAMGEVRLLPKAGPERS